MQYLLAYFKIIDKGKQKKKKNITELQWKIFENVL